MALPILYGNTADRLLGALCNTLIHSLWQGIILAAIAGFIIICTRKASASLRYNLLVCSLLLFAIGAGTTFAWQYQHSAVRAAVIQPAQHIDTYSPPVQIQTAQIQPVQVQPVHIVSENNQLQSISLPERWENYLSAHHNAIVFIWFLIVCARSLQLAFGLYGTNRLRRVRVFAADDIWNERLQQLADSLYIKQTIKLLESGLAKVPMVIGHLKPVILVPVGLLTALSAEEVEAILVHELAHIKRRDYLVNMLQSLVEIVFFFNPAVLWVSKLVKTERENCCDDMVLSQNNNKLNYIRALVSCDQYRSEVPAYAMGLPGSKNTLLSRAKRMATNRNYSLNLFEKTVLAICLVVLGLGVSAFTVREQIQKALKKVVSVIHHEPVSSKAKTTAIDTTKKKQAAQLNDANVLLNQPQLLHPDTLKLNGGTPLNLVNHNLDSIIKLNGNALNLQENEAGSLYLSKLLHPDTIRLAQLTKYNTSTQLLAMSKPDTNLQKMMTSAFKQSHDIGLELYREHLITDTNHLTINMNRDKRELMVNGVRMPDDVFQRISAKYGRKGESGSYSSAYEDTKPGQAQAYTNYNTADAGKQTQDGDEKTRSIIADMLKDGIITTTDDLSFKIGTTEFVVNYKKQPEAVYQKYKAKYVPGHQKGDWIWFYQFDTQKWDQISGRKSSGDFHGTATGVFQGKEDANASGNNSSGYNNSNYYRQNESQKKYWDARQWKLMDEVKRDGLAGNHIVYSFSLSDKQFVINGAVQSDEVFKKYYREYAPANPGPHWEWGYQNRWDANSDSLRNERDRVEAERDKKLVADLLQDGLITDPNNVTFTLTDKKLTINGKKQSENIYSKYKDKYMPDNTGSNWNWTYSHHE